ncbi:hypothetical protein SALBM311S_08508 [Streptomyces alboniger]
MQAGQSRRWLSRVLLGDDQVEFVRDKCPQGCAFILLMHMDAKLRMFALKQLYGRQDQSLGSSLKGCNPQVPLEHSLSPRDIGLSLLEPVQDHLDMPDQHLRRGHQTDPTSQRFQERDADLGLQLRKLRRDGRRTVREGRSHCCKGAAMLEFAQQPKPVKVVHRSPIAARDHRFVA